MKKLSIHEYNIIEHLALRPSSLLIADAGKWLVHTMGWFNASHNVLTHNPYDCDCSLCDARGCLVDNSFLRSLVRKGLLKRTKHKKHFLNGDILYRVQWTLNADKMSLYPELKDLEVQYALGVGK